MTARSFGSSRTTKSALVETPDEFRTEIWAQSFTTWAVGRISPPVLTITPEPLIVFAAPLTSPTLANRITSATTEIAPIVTPVETGTFRFVMAYLLENPLLLVGHNRMLHRPLRTHEFANYFAGGATISPSNSRACSATAATSRTRGGG